MDTQVMGCDKYKTMAGLNRQIPTLRVYNMISSDNAGTSLSKYKVDLLLFDVD